MNKYLKQLIEKYENKSLWDLRALHGQKAMLMPVKEWLEIFNNPLDNNCSVAQRVPIPSKDTYRIQGVMTTDNKYFCYEGTPRYSNIPGFDDTMTFVFIDNIKVFQDSMGYAQDYLYLRSRIPESHRKTFSTAHTDIMFQYLTKIPNFGDIKGYDDFLNRYSDESGVLLCRQKAVNKAVDIYLKRRLKNEDDFKNIEWTIYSEDNSKLERTFFVDNTKSYTDKFTQIILDGGIYE